MTSLPPTLLPESTHAQHHWRGSARRRRILLLALVLGQTLAATWLLLAVLPYHGRTAVEVGIAVLFGLLFTWLSLGFWIALTGFVLRRRGGDPRSLMRRQDAATLAATPLARTAIVMPIYHEPVARSLLGLKAIYQSLEDSGELQHFDFYILSDSRDADVWLQEQAAWQALRQELGAQSRLFYRRRRLNLNHKSGNIADFLRRWGRDYQYMVVLDADSLMGGDTIVQMVQLMQRHSQVGILQTSPRLLNAHSLFARIQQFANQLYGPLFTTGLAAVQLGEAAFWGHNAILRIRPFMQHCGLRRLPGWGLFKGSVLSHDFVEAAYMGRAGQEVWLEPELQASYEESPPTLSDELTRDRRWAKGNLQHLWLMLFSRRLRVAHRLAFLNGIMGYLASPLWFGFLVLTTVEVARLVLWPINYFPQPGTGTGGHHSDIAVRPQTAGVGRCADQRATPALRRCPTSLPERAHRVAGIGPAGADSHARAQPLCGRGAIQRQPALGRAKPQWRDQLAGSRTRPGRRQPAGTELVGLCLLAATHVLPLVTASGGAFGTGCTAVCAIQSHWYRHLAA